MRAFEVGKTYKNKQGNDVRIICVDKAGNALAVVGLECLPGGLENIQCYNADGRYYSLKFSDRDLVPEKETRTVWMNIYPTYGNTSGTTTHHAKERADEVAGRDRITCIPVTIEF